MEKINRNDMFASKIPKNIVKGLKTAPEVQGPKSYKK